MIVIQFSVFHFSHLRLLIFHKHSHLEYLSVHFVDFTRDTKQLGQRFMNGQFKLQSRLFPHSTNHSDLFTVSVPLLKWFDNDILDERKETKIKMDQKSQNKPSFLGQKTDLPRDIVITESLKNQYISFSAHLRVRVCCFATHPPSLSTNSTPKSCYSFNSRENGHRRFLSANS